MQTGEVLAELESETDAGKSGLFLKDFWQFVFAWEHFYKTHLFIQDKSSVPKFPPKGSIFTAKLLVKMFPMFHFGSLPQGSKQLIRINSL